MKSPARLSPALLVFFLVWAAVPAPAQQGCQAPAVIPVSRGLIVFTEEQENHLGDAMAEQIERQFRVIDDDQISAYLRGIGERILKQMPPSSLRYRFVLTDLPVATAFTGPGARIYVSRKLVAFAHNEDELAGVIAHEIGHAATRQLAVHMSRLFRDVLGVTQFSDRADIFQKYHQLIENYGRKPGGFSRGRGEEEKEQIAADQVAAFAAARAGYSPDAFVAAFDRLAQTEGKTGNFFTDLFGATKPEQRRLREMLKILPKVPESCLASRLPGAAAEYQKWQSAVVAYSGLGRRESLHGILLKRALDPPLRADINHVRFSPDGKYLLAQDDASIFVLLSDPLVPLFRIDATDARPAQFSPDSRSVVFYTSSLRVEHWDIENEKRTAAFEIVKPDGCVQTLLSPDGKLLACYEPEFHLTLLDVSSGSTVFQKKSFYVPYSLEFFVFVLNRILSDEELQFLQMGFSADNRYFAAARGGTALVLDLNSRTPVSVPGSLKNMMSKGFAFFGSDRLVALDGEKSALVRFPSGEILQRVTLGPQRIDSATAGDYLLLRPIQDYPVGVMDLATNKIVMANRRVALDVYKDVAVSERVSGDLSLYRFPSFERLASITLPHSPLGRLRATALSPDLKWLALSERSRGAVWNLSNGLRVFHTRGFRGAGFGDQGMLYADFPKFQKSPRSIARLNPASQEITEGPSLEDARAEQHGPILILRKSAKKGESLSQNVSFEVRDPRSNETLWSRHFLKEAPGYFVSPPHEGVLVFFWAVSSSGAKQEIKADPRLQARLATLKEKEGDYLILAVDARTGRTRGKLLVETGKGSFRIGYIEVSGDWLALADTQNRVLLYSLSSGELKGRTFGGRFEISQASGLLCVEADRGRLALHSLTSMEKLDEFVFSSRISLAHFSEDGKRLFVLTANQVVYVFDISTTARASSPTSARP